MQTFAAQLDDIGKPAWIALTIVSFILFWPVGLLVLGFLIGSGRMACWRHGGTDRWQRRIERMHNRMERMQGAAERWGCGNYRASSGNRAFDEYRADTLPSRRRAARIHGVPRPPASRQGYGGIRPVHG